MTGKNNRTAYTVTNPNESTFNLALKGGNKWAMDQIIGAGRRGCAPIHSPARYVLIAEVAIVIGGAL